LTIWVEFVAFTPLCEKIGGAVVFTFSVVDFIGRSVPVEFTPKAEPSPFG